MKSSLIYFSETGNTEKMAELIETGCQKVAGIEVKRMSVAEIDGEFVKQSKAIIFGSPTHGGENIAKKSVELFWKN
jgi:NAD(P)H dehydrogenase (quinone)